MCVAQEMWTDNVINQTCCAGGLQIHKCPAVLWGWSSYCCGGVRPAQQITNPSRQIRTYKQSKSTEQQRHKCQKCTFGARDWLIFSTNQVKVRPYTALAKASRAAMACSKLSGLIICERNIHLMARPKKKKTSPTSISLFICDLFSFGCEFLVSECLPKGRAINSQQLENNNTSVLVCTSTWDLEHIWTPSKTSRTCSDLRKIVDLRLGGDISFSLLPFSKLSVAEVENAADDVQQVLREQTEKGGDWLIWALTNTQA